MINEKLLSSYSNINNQLSGSLLKILVSYIKPSFLFKSDVLIPIHLGRDVATKNSKDGIPSLADLNWLNSNCVGDNNFQGSISHFNRNVGFLTGTYWAWKNYHKIGNPEYFGSFGYRRFFMPDFLSKLTDYDIILPKKDIQQPNLRDFFISSHGQKAYRVMRDAVFVVCPNILPEWDMYMSCNFGYMFEIYILKKDLFFDFCKWIFPILFEILKIDLSEIIPTGAEKEKILCFFADKHWETACNENNFDLYQLRSVGFMMERLTGFYLYNAAKKYRALEQDVMITSCPRQAQIIKLLKMSLKETKC